MSNEYDIPGLNQEDFADFEDPGSESDWDAELAREDSVPDLSGGLDIFGGDLRDDELEIALIRQEKEEESQGNEMEGTEKQEDEALDLEGKTYEELKRMHNDGRYSEESREAILKKIIKIKLGGK